jgi:hypothetical protein
MITLGPTATSDAARRAEIIYQDARSDIDVRLWRAALGTDASARASEAAPPRGGFSLSTLLQLAAVDTPTPAAPVVPRPAQPNPAQPGPAPPVPVAAKTTPEAGAHTGLGPNAAYSGVIADAAKRTGIPGAALATIINAEAAKDRGGAWLAGSRNARSTATGIGQFLAGTWTSEAERAGTWLHATARSNGWIGADGKVLPGARAALLDLRHDADASINATADYARQSLHKIAAAGIAIGSTADQIAKTAYLGHNLGVGDAVKFLRGGLNDGHARRLLDAQIGSASAATRIAAAGSAAAAHRNWLTGFLSRHIRPDRFSI